ncbi:hypothetical protein JW872_00510 [Candidatus Babeliales bacterium]|nr:hypothetical protein [Candidatus Babeliales bacterium]
MTYAPYLLTVLVIVLPLLFAVIGTSLGQGFSAYWSLRATNIQPASQPEIARINLLGSALLESSLVLGLLPSIFLIFDQTKTTPEFYPSIARLGILFSSGLVCMIAPAVSWRSIKKACLAASRQPFFGTKIFQLLLLTMALLQTPVFLSFMITFFARHRALTITTLGECLQILASGIAVGLGSIGPMIGLAHVIRSAIQGVGRNRSALEGLRTFTFLSEGLLGTPIAFSFITALLILLRTTTNPSLLQGILFMSAALTIGLGTMLPGIASGRVASTACKEIAHDPANLTPIRTASFLSQIFLESLTVYAFLVTLILLFFA